MFARKLRRYTFLALAAALVALGNPAVAASKSEPVVVEFFIPFGNMGDYNGCSGEFIQTSGTVRIEALETVAGSEEPVQLRFTDLLSNPEYTRTSFGKAVSNSIAGFYEFATLGEYRHATDPGLDFDVEADGTVYMENGRSVWFWLSATRSASVAGGPRASQ